MAEVCRKVDEWIRDTIEHELRKQERRCKKWPWPLNYVCGWVTSIIRWTTTVLRKITKVVCETILMIVFIFATIINIVYLIPLVGPWLRAIIRVIGWWFSYWLGQLVDGAGAIFGVRATKHLRVHVIPLCVRDVPLAYRANLQAAMHQVEETFYQRAKIRVHTTFHEPMRDPPESALRMGTHVDLVLDHAWLKGTWYQSNTIRLFEDSLAFLLGVWHPIVVYIIEEVGYDGLGNTAGASGGPVVDWVVVERDSVVDHVVAPAGYPSNPVVHPVSPYPPTVALPYVAGAPTDNPFYGKYIIAHELCHALGLLGHVNSDQHELMFAEWIKGDALSPFQVGLIRNSPHVSFF